MKKYSSRELVKMVQKDRWEVVRIEGSHYHFKHNIKKGIVTIPHPRKDLPIGTIKSILNQAGL